MASPHDFNTPEEWLPWLESLSPREIVMGLERVREVLDRLSIARPECVVTIAGTNGKGSCAAMLEALLRADGRRTGCYTSPHLLRYNERMRIDGVAASDEAVVAALRAVEDCRGDVPLTFFEFGTLAALVAFDRAGADAWVLEVGMGGRLDAVNAIAPDVSLITNIGLDHQAWLGNDRESIGREKAGIMRPGVVTVFGAEDVPESVLRTASETGAILRRAGRDFEYRRGERDWRWRGVAVAVAGLAPPPLRGSGQYENAAAVLAVIEALDLRHLLDRDRVVSAWATLRLPGRCQVLQGSRRFIVDVAHNPPAAGHLAEVLANLGSSGRLTAVVGMLADKDVDGFVAPLAPHVSRWIATSTGSRRGSAAGPVAAAIANATGKPCIIADDPGEALATALCRTPAGEDILVSGSFFVVGPALDWLEKHELAT